MPRGSRCCIAPTTGAVRQHPLLNAWFQRSIHRVAGSPPSGSRCTEKATVPSELDQALRMKKFSTDVSPTLPEPSINPQRATNVMIDWQKAMSA